MTFASGWVAILLGLVSLTSVAAVIVAYFRVSLAQATIKTLNESNVALRDRNNEIDAVVVRMDARMLVLENDNRVLREAVAGKQDITVILDAITHHHQEVMADRDVLTHRLTDVTLELGRRVDASHRSVSDVLRLLGNKREDPA